MTAEYVTEELLSAGRSALVYRARRGRDQLRVVFKALRPESRGPAGAERLRGEYNRLRLFDDPGIARVLALDGSGDDVVLVMEDAGGRSLVDVVDARGPVDVGKALHLACELVRILEVVHRAGVLHRDVSPANLVVDDDLRRIVLVDFDLAVVMPDDEESVPAVDALIGTAAFVPPEQTGRVRGVVDPRADLYGLGATLYFALAGHPPFDVDDLGELVHAHLAMTPRSISEVAPRVPPALASIIDRLLAKDPARRYSGATALRRALERCRKGWLAGDLDARELADEPDPGASLPPAPTLIGQGPLIDRIRAALTPIEPSSGHLVTLSGASGSGKSQVVAAVAGVLAPEGVRLAIGKFDQHAEVLPYVGLVGAFRTVIGPFLDAASAETRENLAASIGSMASLAATALPELAGIFPATLLERPVEFSERAFQGVLRVLLEQIAPPTRPLVIVLDDVQWADPATLDFLEGIVDAPADASLAWLLTLRADALTATHPLTARLDRLCARARRVARFEVEALTQAETSALIDAWIDLPPTDVEAVSARVHLAAEGNPLHIGVLLEVMVERDELRYDRARGRWRYRERPQQPGESGALEVLVSTRIESLPPVTRRVLEVAALIGSSAPAEIVAAALAIDVDSLGAHLTRAAQAGLVHGDPDRQENSTSAIVFLHDRMREAVLRGLTDEDAQALHLATARAYGRSNADANDAYAISRHYEAAGVLLVDRNERRAAARVALRAAARARRSGAQDAALRFVAFALSLVEEVSWGAEYDLMFAVQLEYLECEFLAGALDEAEARGEMLLERVRDPIDRATVLVTLVRNDTNRHQYDRAIRRANEGLAGLGVAIPTEVVRWKIARDAFHLRWYARKLRSSAQILALPKLHDSRIRAALRLTLVSQAAFIFSDPDLLMARAFYALRLSLRHGISDLCATLFSTYAPLVIHQFGDIRAARVWLDAAIHLNENEPNPMIEGMTGMNVEVFSRAWFEPLREVRPRLEATLRRSRLLGDQAYTVFSAQHSFFLAWFEGVEVSSLIERAITARNVSPKSFHGDLTTVFDVFEAVLKDLSEEPRAGPSSSFLSEVEPELPPKNGHAELVMYTWHYFRLASSFFLRTPPPPSPEGSITRWGRSVSGSIARVDYSFYRALHLAALHADQPSNARKRNAETMERHLASLRRWGRQCPANFEARWLLAEAEVIRVLRPDAALSDRYLAAHASARRYGALHLEALALELGARHELSLGRETAAQMLLREAASAYRRWGARAVAARVERELAELGGEAPATPRGRSSSANTSASSQSSSLNAVDLAAVLRVSQAIAREIALEPLLRTLMQTLLESAGARRCALALVTNERLRIEARAAADPREIVVLESIPLHRAIGVPRALLERVAATREVEILDDEAARAAFPADEHLLESCPLSMMCIPIDYQGELVGVLYLENDLIRGVFSPDRALFLTQLTAQITAVLVNARQADAYRRFVPHEFLDLLGKKRITDIRLGDHVQREMTVMFADIRDFSKRCERMTPRESFFFVNAVLAGTGPDVRKHGGFIDKYLGDAIMALFPNGADDALRSAIEMCNNIHVYNDAHHDDPDHEDIRIGIGLNSGMLMLGTIGEHGRMDGTVISDAVNLASRVEGITKLYGVELLLTEFTRERLTEPDAFTMREVDRVRVKGRVQPVTIYEVLDVQTADQRTHKEGYRERFDQALADFRRGDLVPAQAAFAALAAENPDDRALSVYLERCAFLLEHGLPSDWDGVFQLSVK